MRAHTPSLHGYAAGNVATVWHSSRTQGGPDFGKVATHRLTGAWFVKAQAATPIRRELNERRALQQSVRRVIIPRMPEAVLIKPTHKAIDQAILPIAQGIQRSQGHPRRRRPNRLPATARRLRPHADCGGLGRRPRRGGAVPGRVWPDADADAADG